MILVCSRNPKCPLPAKPSNRLTSPLPALLHTRAGASNCATMKIPTGTKFGRLTVIDGSIRLNGQLKLKCRCDCGTEKFIRPGHLSNNTTQSCGCLASELSSKRATVHGELVNHSPRTPEYKSWQKMIGRCVNPNNHAYENYGGRGISVFPDWVKSFAVFLSYIGRKPTSEHSIERIENGGNYEPGNVRWATMVEQANNRRTNRRISFCGTTLTAAQWELKTGIKSFTILERIKRGWSITKTLTTI